MVVNKSWIKLFDYFFFSGSRTPKSFTSISKEKKWWPNNVIQATIIYPRPNESKLKPKCRDNT